MENEKKFTGPAYEFEAKMPLKQAIPLGLLYVVYNRVISYVMTEFSVLSNFMAFMPVSAVFRILLPVGLILGMGIGLVGSIFTIRKHLKV